MEVIRNQEFLLLSAEEVAKLLASDDLNVPSEEMIFQASIRFNICHEYNCDYHSYICLLINCKPLLTVCYHCIVKAVEFLVI